MSQLPTQSNLSPQILETVLLTGDLSRLNPQQKLSYYRDYCVRLGLDPVTRPFDVLRLNGKEIMYCGRSGAAQLNKIHKVSHEIVNREKFEDIYVVTAKASANGRSTESTGAVVLGSLKGEALCNAMMKAETKAKRRASLDLLGLGIMDESELDTLKPVEPTISEKERRKIRATLNKELLECKGVLEINPIFQKFEGQYREILDSWTGNAKNQDETFRQLFTKHKERTVAEAEAAKKREEAEREEAENAESTKETEIMDAEFEEKAGV
jgi:hypothetical protein